MPGPSGALAASVTSLADPWIDALRHSHQHVASFVEGLGPDQLRQTSTADEWTVAQVLSHLGSGAEINLGGLRAQLDGAENTVENQAVWDRWNNSSPEEQATNFVAVDDELISTYEGMDDSTRNSLRISLGFLPEPIDLATAVGMRLSEHAFHSWDVFSTFDPDAAVDRPSTDLLVAWASPVFRFMANGEWTGDPGVIELRLSDPELTLALAVGDETSLTPGPASGAAGRLEIPAEAWLRLTYGRLKGDHVPAGITSEPTDLVDRLRSLFKGF
jgi:uncharacterized protein (TIGR03083 family)